MTFRPLRRADFPRVAAWLAEPLVARWWHHETSLAAVERDFGPIVDGRDATDIFFAALENWAFGLIQRYPIAAYPEYVEELSAVCAVPLGALSIDYFIGDPQALRRGLGTAMIATLVRDSWPCYPDAHEVLVPVAAGNIASWRALEGAGFRRIAEGDLEPDNPCDPRDHYIYRIGRPGTDDSQGTTG